MPRADESLWAHASGDLHAPSAPEPLGADPTTADRERFARQRAALTARKSRDAAAFIALSCLLPESEETHVTQVRIASEFLTAIKARYSTPTPISLGRLFLPFLFLDLSSFEHSADLIAHLCSLDSSYLAACTDAQLALLPPLPPHPPPPWRLILILSSLASLTALPHNLHSVAPAFGAVPPPLFHGCTVPQLPTFTASLAATATDETAAAVSTSARSRVRSGRRGGQGAANSGGGGGGVASDGGGSAGVGGVPRAASSGSPVAASGGDARVRRHLQGCQLQVLGWRLGTWLSSSRSSHSSSGGSSRFSGTGKDRVRSVLRMAYRADGPAPDWLPLVLSHGPAQWDMSASQLLELSGTANAMYAVVDSSASDSICSLVFSLGASVDHVPVASVVVCVGASPGATLADASLSFMLDSSVSHCFFRDHMTLTPLLAPFSVALADPTSGPVIARHSTTLPCPAVPSGSLTGLHIPSFSRSLVGVQPLVSQHVGVWFEPFGDSATSVDGDTYAPLDTLL
ncbi:unnamed protein product [Closterium sp. NIES-53]